MAAYICRGGCHCGAVTFELRLPRKLQVRCCNCSICSMSGHQHLTVPHEDFKLLTGEDQLVEYRFNTGAARHLFCRRCGIKSFYQPRSHPEAWSVNLRCVRLDPSMEVEWGTFDGQNWEQHLHEIRDVVNRT